MLTAFVVAFSLPYFLNDPYAALKSKVGFMFGSIAVCALVFTFFCVPECNGKSLEEIEFMFTEGVPLKKFGSYEVQEKFENAIKKETGGMGGISETSMVEEQVRVKSIV